jgi:hypothetical protein
VSLDNITLDDLLAELGVLNTQTFDGYRTSSEWRDALNVSEPKIKKLLRLADKQGRLAVQHERRLSVDRTTRMVPVYRFEMGEKAPA